MTPLRQRMIREMELRQFSPCTVESYLTAVIGLQAFLKAYLTQPVRLPTSQIELHFDIEVRRGK